MVKYYNKKMQRVPLEYYASLHARKEHIYIIYIVRCT